MAEPLQTPLYDRHLALGATLTDFAGWSMPLRYGSDRAEHEAVRTRAGIFDLSHMAQLEVEGPLAAECLDASLVTMPSTMSPGRARYSLIVDSDGGILDDLIVYRLAEQSFLVVANAANRLLVRDELTARSRAHCESVQRSPELSVTDATLHRTMIAVQGPLSREIVAALAGREADVVERLGYYRVVELEIAGVPVRLARTGYTGEMGYELMAPAAAAGPLWDRLLEGEAGLSPIPCGIAARDSLRLEAGMPLYGHELTRETAPVDVGLARMVNKHRFVGGEVLAQRPQKWNLHGLVGAGRRAARAGCQVRLGDETVGLVTSGMLSPTLGVPIALALLRPGVSLGTELAVDVRGKTLPMTTVALPFYARGNQSN